MLKERTATDPYVALFDSQVEARGNIGPSWLLPLRRAALSRFGELGFPTRHHEEWKYTVVTPIAETTFAVGEKAAVELAGVAFGNLPCHRITFVNGHYAPELSKLETVPGGVTIGSLADALARGAEGLEPHLGRYASFQENAFVALNTALFADGGFVHIPRNVVVETPIQILYLTTETDGPTMAHPRTLLIADAGSQATVLETFVSLHDGTLFHNAVTEIVVAENAHLTHYKAAKESDNGWHIATMQVQLAQNAHFASQNITLGGLLVRNDHNAVLNGENGHCTLNGLYQTTGKQLVDNHTMIDHAMPHCESHELYKGVLDDQSRGVFNGKIFVRLDAQKTDAKQTNQALLLSKDALVNTKPQLEIYADDVKCTHGATIGQLDKEALFYLRSRGIGADDARALLVQAFTGDIVDRIHYEPFRDEIASLLFSEQK